MERCLLKVNKDSSPLSFDWPTLQVATVGGCGQEWNGAWRGVWVCGSTAFDMAAALNAKSFSSHRNEGAGKARHWLVLRTKVMSNYQCGSQTSWSFPNPELPSPHSTMSEAGITVAALCWVIKQKTNRDKCAFLLCLTPHPRIKMLLVSKRPQGLGLCSVLPQFGSSSGPQD